MRMDFVTPAGFRDVLGDEAQVRERLSREVQARFAADGYVPVETPTLEMMDVMRASGRIAASPFKLFDSQGDLLAMRPDVTLQVARMVATRLADQPGPFRFRYLQRVFREAEGRMQAAARELTQIGIECIGETGPTADAEVVGLLADALQLADVHDFRLAIATVGVLRSLLEKSGAPLPWKTGVLNAFHASNFVEIDRLVGQAAAVGVPPRFAHAIGALPRIRGRREAIEEARALAAPLGCEGGLDDFAATFDALVGIGLGERLLVDFSVMSSFNYYTGVVFEAYAPGLGTPLGGGGRYDNMIGAYGRGRPAAGFAFFLEQAMAASLVLTSGRAAEKPEAAHPRSLAPKLAGESERAAAPAACPADCGPRAAEALACFDGSAPLRIAVPKGSLNADTIAALRDAGLDVEGLADSGRTLVIRNPGVEYVIVRPTDAPSFVALGAADCGICGKDSLLEADPDVVELADLGFGACRFVVAQPAGAGKAVDDHYRRLGSIRVATKYPRITRAHYAKTGVQVEIVQLHGNIELAPLTGMAERIVDITATGTTLRENDLVVVEDVLSSTARFFSNTCAFRTDPRIVQLARKLQQGAKPAPQLASEKKE